MAKKLGNTVGVNQLWNESKIPSDSAIYSTSPYTVSGVTITKNGDGSISVVTDANGATARVAVKIATSNTMPLNHTHFGRGSTSHAYTTSHPLSK